MGFITETAGNELTARLISIVDQQVKYQYEVEQKLLIQLITAQNETNRLLQELSDYLRTK